MFDSHVVGHLVYITSFGGDIDFKSLPTPRTLIKEETEEELIGVASVVREWRDNEALRRT